MKRAYYVLRHTAVFNETGEYMQDYYRNANQPKQAHANQGVHGEAGDMTQIAHAPALPDKPQERVNAPGRSLPTVWCRNVPPARLP